MFCLALLTGCVNKPAKHEDSSEDTLLPHNTEVNGLNYSDLDKKDEEPIEELDSYCGAVTSESEQIYKINDNVVGSDEYSNELDKFNDGKTYKTVSYDDCVLITESNIDKLLSK